MSKNLPVGVPSISSQTVHSLCFVEFVKGLKTNWGEKTQSLRLAPGALRAQQNEKGSLKK